MRSDEGRAIDVLLVEDDPGEELITREAFEHDKIKNTLHVARDGEEGLDFLYRRGAYQDAPRPDLILLDLNLHANAYVAKPVDLDQFIKAVRQIDQFFVQVVRLPGR